MTRTAKPSRAHLTLVPCQPKPPRNWKRGPYTKRPETRLEQDARRARLLHAIGESPRLVR